MLPLYDKSAQASIDEQRLVMQVGSLKKMAL